METLNITREQVNEAIGKFADVFLNDLGVAIADEEPSEPELTGTRFKAIDINGTERVMDAASIPSGTLVVEDVYEYFRCYPHPTAESWVKHTGRRIADDEFAEEMRAADTIPRIVHLG